MLVVAELASRDSQVLALGGGAVLREENRQIIGTRGKAIWLQASAATIHQRLAGDPTTVERRPDLTAYGGYNEIAELLKRREPIYRQCADFAVDTEGKSLDQLADEILAFLRGQGLEVGG